MEDITIGIYREHARVFRTGCENIIKAELKAQADAVKAGKKPTLQTLTKKGAEAMADNLNDMAATLAENGKPSTEKSANAIDRMTDDFAATASDLRRIASGDLKARSKDEAKEHAAKAAAAQKALAEAQAALAELSRDSKRLS